MPSTDRTPSVNIKVLSDFTHVYRQGNSSDSCTAAEVADTYGADQASSEDIDQP